MQEERNDKQSSCFSSNLEIQVRCSDDGSHWGAFVGGASGTWAGGCADPLNMHNKPSATVGSQSLFRMAKSRWEIENQGFNDAKSRHGLEHICHHHANSLLIGWLLTMLALTIERLYRLRYLHRGKHRVHSSAQLQLLLWLSLSRPCAINSS
jgi:hypothetical protein